MDQAAAEAFDPPPAPDPDAVATRAKRRRGAQRAAGASFAMLALLGTVMVAIRAEPARQLDEATAGPATAQDLAQQVVGLFLPLDENQSADVVVIGVELA